MRLAILSDIHGNLLALEAVLADLAAQGGADAVVVAGDLCLDGPRPREVLERLQALGFRLPVVRLDVQMHAAIVIYGLDKHLDVGWDVIELAISGILGRGPVCCAERA